MKGETQMKSRTLLPLIAALCFSALTLPAATAAGPKVFDTPEAAADALVKAADSGDIAALVAILGPGGKDLVSSGDPVEDKNDLSRFAAKAKEKMSISYDSADPNLAILVAGNDDWPMPIPIVKRGVKWQFNLKDGKREVLARRIGNNELEAIMLLRGYVEAQHEYASRPRDGNKLPQYAQKWISSPGKQDGLTWWNPDGTPGGPIGDEIAKLLAAGYKDKAAPINGYYFRALTAQGPDARLGARDYIVQGRMIGGFAAIAWPANYGVTGVQTFQVNNDGLVYQKDLGPETAKLAPAIKKYNPDKTWSVTDDAP
jgi:hypothetical protein